MTPARVVLLTCMLVAIGCGGPSLSHRVDASKLRDMSRHGQLWIYDAENEIVIALDRLDEAQDEMREIRRRKRQAERAVESAEKSGKSQLVQVAEAWLVHLESMERWARLAIRAETTGVVAARAAVELAKAQVVQREDLLAGKDFSVKIYQVQHNELRAEYDAQKKKANNARRTARKKEQAWWEARRRFVASSGDYDTGLWIE